MKIDTSALSALKSFNLFAAAKGEASSAIAKLSATAGASHAEVIQSTGDRPYAFTRDNQHKQANNDARAAFRSAVEQLFGGFDEIPASVKAEMKLDDYDGKGHPLTARRINKVTTAVVKALRGAGRLESANGGYLNTTDVLLGMGAVQEGKTVADMVTGSGPAADAVRAVIEQAAAQSPDQTDGGKLDFITRSANESAAGGVEHGMTTLLRKNYVDEKDGVRKENFARIGNQFERDLQGGQTISIPGVGMIGTDPVKARDALTKFVLDGEKDTFDEATPEEQKRVTVLISLVSQYCGTAMDGNGFMAGFTPEGSEFPVVGISTPRGGIDFNLSKGDNGDIRINVGLAANLQAISNSAGQLITVPQGSYMDVTAEITLPKTNLDTLAKADWTQLSREGEIPENCRFTGTVSVRGTINIAGD